MGSSRFPGKVIYDIQGIPLISHCIRRLRLIDENVALIVATSDLEIEEPLVEIVKKENCFFFRGDEQDVLDRFYRLALSFLCPDYIIRATGDNPLIDPYEAKKIIKKINEKNWDYIAGFSDDSIYGLPKGVGLEAFSMKALSYAWNNGKKLKYREHINEFFFDNQDKFNIFNIKCEQQNSYPDLNLSVDTYEDLRFLLTISKKIGKPLIDLTTEEIIFFLQSERPKNVYQ